MYYDISKTFITDLDGTYFPNLVLSENNLKAIENSEMQAANFQQQQDVLFKLQKAI